MIALIAAVGTVLFVSTLCSLLEAVLYSVPRSHVETMAEQGRPSGRILRRLRENIDQPIAAILSLNTVAHTVGAAVAGAMVAAVYGEEWLGWFSAGFTLVVLLLTEILPKTAGVVYNRRLAGSSAHVIQWLVWGMKPLVWLCQLTTRLVTRKASKESGVSDRELIVMTNLGLKAGTIDSSEAEVIRNILTIEKKKAHEVMTPHQHMVTLPADMTADEAARQPDFYRYSRFPVYDRDEDDLIGLVHRPQVLRALAEDRHSMPMDALMTSIEFVSESTPVNRLLHLFLERREQLFAVIDSAGKVTGLVALEDVLEEILGKHIVDEDDRVVDLRELAHRRRDRARTIH